MHPPCFVRGIKPDSFKNFVNLDGTLPCRTLAVYDQRLFHQPADFYCRVKRSAGVLKNHLCLTVKVFCFPGTLQSAVNEYLSSVTDKAQYTTGKGCFPAAGFACQPDNFPLGNIKINIIQNRLNFFFPEQAETPADINVGNITNTNNSW
jgi:hypothetical protein